MRQQVFCYGSLMIPRLLDAVIGRHAATSPATLMGYARATLPGRPYPGLWPCDGAQIPGRLITLSYRRELHRLDDYEGDEYRRCRLRVSTPQGWQHAWVYLPRTAQPQREQPWSQRHFEKRQLPRYLRHIAARHAAGVADANTRTA